MKEGIEMFCRNISIDFVAFSSVAEIRVLKRQQALKNVLAAF